MNPGKGRGKQTKSKPGGRIHQYFTCTSSMSGSNDNSGKQTAQKDLESASHSDVTNRDIAKLIERLENKLTLKFEEFEGKFNTRLLEIEKKFKDVDAIKDALKNTNSRVTEVETSLQFMSQDNDEMKEQTALVTQLKNRIDKLEADRLYQEQRSRKYNLLFYGIPERLLPGNSGEKEEDT